MSEKMTQEQFLKKFELIYPNEKIEILDYNGMCGPIEFRCSICGEVHKNNSARNLFATANFCQKEKQSNKKWDLLSFENRIERVFGRDRVTFIKYNGLSNPVEYRCNLCGEIKKISTARSLFYRNSLCEDCDGAEKNIIAKKLEDIFKDNIKYERLSWGGKMNNKVKIRCKCCENIFERYPVNIIKNPDVCPACNSGAQKQKIDLAEVQKRIDDSFGVGEYLILDYKGQLHKDNKIKCLTCGLIFNTQLSYFTQNTRGCPKCKRFKSKGEQKVEKFLQDNNIRYEAQKRFKDCNNNLSSFDFCAYKDNQEYLIEVNGVQHYKPTNHFGPLELIQKRDLIKYNYCFQNDIPLIIIPYDKLNDSDIEQFLSFLKGSTTISKESRE